jgi:hypothetical protein
VGNKWQGYDKYEIYVAGVGYVGTCNSKTEAKNIAAHYAEASANPSPGAPQFKGAKFQLVKC